MEVGRPKSEDGKIEDWKIATLRLSFKKKANFI